MYGSKYITDYSTELDDLKAARGKMEQLEFTIEVNNKEHKRIIEENDKEYERIIREKDQYRDQVD